jgi:hypothetical protein
MDKVMAVFNEVSFGLALHGDPAGLFMNNRAANSKPKSAEALLSLDALTVRKWSLGHST